jgi:hypothetical protein
MDLLDDLAGSPTSDMSNLPVHTATAVSDPQKMTGKSVIQSAV